MKITKTRKEKKIELALDVLAQLRAKKFLVKAGTYIINGTRYRNRIQEHIKNLPYLETTELREVIKEVEKTEPCKVCALGAAFLCKLKKEDNLVANGFTYGIGKQDITRYLQDIFSEEEMRVIEREFEKKDIGYTWKRGCVFLPEIKNKSTRLRLIFENIAVNGTFLPLQPNVYFSRRAQEWRTRGINYPKRVVKKNTKKSTDKLKN